MSDHVWRFFRAGGFDQVRIEAGADILALDDLDKKLWVALACPATGMEFDERTLAALDLDHDGRIRASEVIKSVRWLRQVLADPEELSRDGDSLALSAISKETPEGRRVHASARRILASLGHKGAEHISVENAADTEHLFDQTDFNGDGVIPASAAEDSDTASVIEDIIAVYGAVEDRSGKPGIDRDTLTLFQTDLDSFGAWWDRDRLDAAVLPLGEDSHAAYQAMCAVEGKIDDYFERCRLSAYTAAAAEAANPDVEFFAPLSQRPLAEYREILSGLALAEIAPGHTLPLSAGLNPAWRAPMEAFCAQAVTPLLGHADKIGEAEWAGIKSRFAAHRAWRADRPHTVLDSLGEERIRALRKLDRKAAIDALIDKDLALEDEASAIGEVLRLTLLRRDFLHLLNNFVSFREFYSGRRATFQAGTLYLDGRSCELCVKVEEVAKHAQLAVLSKIYLAYCDCRRPVSGEQMFIAAAFTAGDSDKLMVGRNGIFYDCTGKDWDATVVKLVEHPISMRQAFFAPYKQAAHFIGEQVQKVAQAKSKAIHEDFSKAIVTKASGPLPVPPPVPGHPAAAAPATTPFDIGRFAGVFAAIGLAIGAIGTALAQVVSSILHLAWWQMPLALAALIGAISGPSMVLTYVKLRQRDLAPVLDANGWAVNARVKINIPFGSTLTAVAKLPEGAERSLSDPYAEKKVPWKLYLAFLIMAGAAALAIWLGGGVEKLLRQAWDHLWSKF